MLARARLISASHTGACPFHWDGNKAIFDLPATITGRFDLEMIFSDDIRMMRRHDYTWQRPRKDFTAGPFAPKILQLSGGKYVQPNSASGYWETPNARTLIWRFNPAGSAPVVRYAPGTNAREIISAEAEALSVGPALLFTSDAVEFSRSEIPFSAVACFTDHCDFDTRNNLEVQREFFKNVSLRVTKGFFLDHYSKRDDNASFERDGDELTKWRTDGHELAYHSLSQSIKGNKDSLDAFRDFEPPFNHVPAWIDHGYQPYNLTMYRHTISDAEFAANMENKGIVTLWNYIDSGTAAKGVINQLNPDDFTLARFGQSINGSISKRLSTLAKAIMFHHYADEKIVGAYKSAAGSLKRLLQRRKFADLRNFAASAFGMTYPMGKVFLNWPWASKKIFRLARFSPVLFTHTIAGKKFHVFQTLEMVDFRASLCKENIDRLMAESGLFIAHTYFSVPHGYHTGRMIRDGKIDPEVAANFKYLGQMSATGKIWNPTLAELVRHLAKFEQATLDADKNGRTIVNAGGLHFRYV